MAEFSGYGYKSGTVKRMHETLWEKRRTDYSEDGVMYTLEEFARYYFDRARIEGEVCTFAYIRDMWMAAGRPRVGNFYLPPGFQ